jgi:hypothetical protein
MASLDSNLYQTFGVKDLYQVFDQEENLAVNAQGDFATVAQEELTVQRILRRLLTNPGDLLAHPEYGAGIKRYIGQILTTEKYGEIQSNIVSQILLESAVAKNPPPVVELQAYPNAINADITYYSASTNKPYSFSFEISN